ncbi:acyl-CoA dehydrogenase family protein [Cumulibacter manganitolerans]|uniref:acyl-CoA dehydrogenase family protein n=1 Tax=Cumulibacter manganitolerans TaxID=1884992 RepID=UPI001E3BAF2F|nr:acyl-CoA dehydrogenase family protein [Cumulibacter manganitolerans]
MTHASTPVDETLTEDEIAFRDEVRAFLDEHLTDDLRRAGRLSTSVYPDHEASMQWQEILRGRGWAAPSWPVEYGGCDWSPTQHYIFSRELTLAGAPGLSPMGIRMVSYAIMRYGTQEQKDYFLPRILTGEVFFCQGYSEPEAGSDLAALATRGEIDGDDLVVTGSKIWTTHATEANWIFCLVRTSRGETKQRGITFVLIDMTSPGIEVQPLVMSSGERVQNQVFFDGVRVPLANVLGEVDDGWSVAKYLLLFERGGSAASPGLKVRADAIREQAASQTGPDGGPLSEDPSFVRRLAELEIRIDVLDALERRVLAALTSGADPGTASSMQKILSTELSQDLTHFALETAGPIGRAYQPHATKPGGPVVNFVPPDDGYVAGQDWQAAASSRYFNDRAGSIYAGSNEIQRNIIAKARWGLS